jgi:hypothetical protein
MNIPERTLDLIDELANHGFQPRSYSGRFMNGKKCVACVMPWNSGYTLDDFPQEGQIWDNLGLDTIIYWPGHEWTPAVEKYVETVFDPSGDGVSE